ncbi:RNA polymerase sigma-I factor [Alkaliphilus peptidifermentans]|uniref:RNA polymerase sigma-I factor n=1 Tax=Alkaliphilus peptidifermentans TaxID=426129 RepID=UPI000B806FA7|nr:RNA polymerase sigma-I factor [Alkaliphilus peptidifermentans]
MTKLLKQLLKKEKTLEERIRLIQSGDQAERNRLIKEYIPFIQKNTSKQLGKYVDMNNDDLYSVGLMAFNEALDKFNEEKGSFLSFASMVIKSRIVDQLRKDSKNSKEVYLSQYSNEENNNFAEDLVAVDSFEASIEAKLDMEQLVKEMNRFGVTLDDLINQSPKHFDTRLKAIEISRFVYESKSLKEKLMRTYNLPVTDIIAELHISKKVIQRSRKFIIALVLIQDSNLDTMKHYISQIERRG